MWDRSIAVLTDFFKEFGKERCAEIKVVCSDMWKPKEVCALVTVVKAFAAGFPAANAHRELEPDPPRIRRKICVKARSV
jgi:hypothetical protein